MDNGSIRLCEVCEDKLCEVCEDAHSMHYGVLTCKRCSEFFGRTVNKNLPGEATGAWQNKGLLRKIFGPDFTAPHVPVRRRLEEKHAREETRQAHGKQRTYEPTTLRERLRMKHAGEDSVTLSIRQVPFANEEQGTHESDQDRPAPGAGHHTLITGAQKAAPRRRRCTGYGK